MHTAQPLPLKNITIASPFWQHYLTLVKNTVLPYQWELLNDRVEGTVQSGCIRNFRIAAGLETGSHTGTVFQDSDLAKWLEAAANVLAAGPDPYLEQLADQAIDLVARAQLPDGYLNTYYTIEDRGGRWKNLRDGHELYCAGHFIEAGVAHCRATGKENLLNVCIRLADHICATFGPEPEQIPGYPGHQEIESALVRLSELTGNPAYLAQARYFLLQRGAQPQYFDEEQLRDGYRPIFPEIGTFGRAYAQTHRPVRQQTTAEGHAVRATYQYAAMADVAAAYDDDELYRACQEIYRNLTGRRMYLTGGIGSSNYGERFTCDYDLPNDTAYAETCASIGLMRFSQRMFLTAADARYGDVIERALYNTVLAGISFSGDRFFYVNPLELVPARCAANHDLSHVKVERQKWFGVACCPPNIARTIPALGSFAFAVSEDTFFVQMYVASTVTLNMHEIPVTVTCETGYPDDGNLSISITARTPVFFTLAIRIPGWCTCRRVLLDGQDRRVAPTNGYLMLSHRWTRQTVTVENDMEAKPVYPNPKITQDAGKVAVQRGPFVYCAEEADNGADLSALSLEAQPDFAVLPAADGLPDFIKPLGCRAQRDIPTDALYAERRPETQEVSAILIPYCAWNNREPGEMRVWLRRNAI